MIDLKMFKDIKLLVLDVDGIMTDGSIYFSDSGEILRAYSVVDGYGIMNAIKKGLKISVISGGKSESIVKRCNSLGVEIVITGREDKLEAYEEKIKPYYSIDDKYVAFMGDDVYDIPLLKKVKLPVTVPDSIDEVKKISKYICKKSGGKGAVRELIDLII